MTITGRTAKFLSPTWLIGMLICSAGGAAGPDAAQTPSAKTTGGEKRLGEFASQMRLDRSVTEGHGAVVITNETVRAAKKLGSLTSGQLAARSTNTSGGRTRLAKRESSEERRAMWRKAVDEARDAIADTKHELALLDAKIDSLEDAAFDAGPGAVRLWARYEEARQRRRAIEQSLKRQQARLEAVIRRARRQGAQPGWFR